MADSVSPVQCLLFVRAGDASPQLSSTVSCPPNTMISYRKKHLDWALAAVTVTLLLLWAGSSWYSFIWASALPTSSGPRYLVSLTNGRLSLWRIQVAPDDPMYDAICVNCQCHYRSHATIVRQSPAPASFLPFATFDPARSGVAIPLWAPVLLSLVVLYVRSYKHRRTRDCDACGYSLRGLTSQTCPECGRPAIAQHATGS